MSAHDGWKVFVWHGTGGVNFEAATDEREPVRIRFVWDAATAAEVAGMLLRQAANAIEADA